MLPQTKEHQTLPGVGRGKKGPSAWTSDGSTVLPTPWFWTASPQNCERINSCCAKALNMGKCDRKLTLGIKRSTWRNNDDFQLVAICTSNEAEFD